MICDAYELLCHQLQHDSLKGMTKQAALILDYMKDGYNPSAKVDVCTCLDVRSRTLAIYPLSKDHMRIILLTTITGMWLLLLRNLEGII